MARILKGILVEDLDKPYPYFEEGCKANGLPVPQREIKFHPTRQWRFDFAWTKQRIALEVEGGAFSGKGHRNIGKFLRDMEKYNEAQIAGWKVLRCTTKDMNSKVYELLKRVL